MLILRLSKREDQALIPISTILKFSAQLAGILMVNRLIRQADMFQNFKSHKLNF